MAANLMLHDGGRSVSMGELKAVQVPEATSTYFPVAYDRIVEMATSALQSAGYRIDRQQFGLARGGQRFFGTFDVQSEIAGGVGLAVGLRSSLDKKFAIGFAVGSRVFVCDNLAFSGERVLKAKNTRFGSDRYYDGICESVAGLVAFQETERLWIERMEATPVDDRQAADLILRSTEAGIVGVQSILDVAKEWRNPSLSSQAGRNAWGLFNCFTYAMKTQRAETISRRTVDLRGLFATAI